MSLMGMVLGGVMRQPCITIIIYGKDICNLQ
jgi:hypothetical protein